MQKLACQGSRKPGALVFLPELEGRDFRFDLAADVDELAAAAEGLLHGRSEELSDRLVGAGLSPGGAQPKAALAFDQSFTSALAVDSAPEGYSEWLVKFDLVPGLCAGRIELAYHRMAAAAGITVPETRLLESQRGSAHFLTRRFDRASGGRRIHVHTFSGLTHTPVREPMEYGELLELTRGLVGGDAVVAEIFRRAAFNILAGNDDDHGRNHAFLMDADGQWSLAPAYDLNPASNPLSSGLRAGTIAGKAIGIRREDLLRFADDHGIESAEHHLREVEAAIKAWPEYAQAAGIPEALWSEIQNQQGRNPGA